MVTFKTDLATCCPSHLQGDFVNIFSLKNLGLCFLLIVCLFQTIHEKVRISETDWCAVVKSVVEQIAKKKNLELLFVKHNYIWVWVSEILFSVQSISWILLKQSNSDEVAAFQLKLPNFDHFRYVASSSVENYVSVQLNSQCNSKVSFVERGSARYHGRAWFSYLC